MKKVKLTLELSVIEYASIMAWCAVEGTTPANELITTIDTQIGDRDEEEMNTEIYNEAFEKAVKSKGFELNEEGKKKHLLGYKQATKSNN